MVDNAKDSTSEMQEQKEKPPSGTSLGGFEILPLRVRRLLFDFIACALPVDVLVFSCSCSKARSALSPVVPLETATKIQNCKQLIQELIGGSPFELKLFHGTGSTLFALCSFDSALQRGGSPTEEGDTTNPVNPSDASAKGKTPLAASSNSELRCLELKTPQWIADKLFGCREPSGRLYDQSHLSELLVGQTNHPPDRKPPEEKVKTLHGLLADLLSPPQADPNGEGGQPGGLWRKQTEYSNEREEEIGTRTLRSVDCQTRTVGWIQLPLFSPSDAALRAYGKTGMRVGFSLSARKLKRLLSSLPSGPGVVETLRCGPHVCKDACLPVLLDFLLRLKAGGARGAPSISLKTLSLARSRLRRVSVEDLASVFSFGWLPNLLSLDLSDNPLGPSGLKAFARGLSSSPQSLPLQSLKLARTKAKAEGVGALAEALKAKKTTSLQTLDLAENEMRPAGLKHFASAVNAEAVPHLKVLVLKKNELADVTDEEKDYAPISELLTTNALKELEEFDLSDNCLFDEDFEEIGDEGEVWEGLADGEEAEDGGGSNGESGGVQNYSLLEGVDEIGGGGVEEDADGDGDGDGSVYQVELGSIFPCAAALAVPGRFPKLRRLDLGSTDFLEEGVCMASGELAAFATALGVGGLPFLQELVLPGGGFRQSPIPEGVVALANALTSGHRSRLKCLKMQSRYNVTGEVFAGLCRSLVTGKVSLLQSLDLKRYNDDAEEGVLALAEGIQGQRLSSLESFRLKLPYVKGFAVSGLGLAFGCGGCPGLQKLDLKWSEEGDEGVRGLAEGLGGGRLSFLRDLSLILDCGVGGEGEREWAGEGCKALGEVLSTGKVPSLRTVSLGWHRDKSFARLSEGLSRGRVDPPLLLDINFLGAYNGCADVGVTRFVKVIRAGKLSGLRKVSLEGYQMLSRKRTEGTQSLSALVTGGRVPSLKDLEVNLRGIGQHGMQALAAALSSPHISALRRLHVSSLSRLIFPPSNFAAEAGMLSGWLSSGHLRRLEEVRVGGLWEIELVRAVCVGLGTGKLSSLGALHFWDCRFGGEGGRALSELLVAEKLPSLRVFEAGGTRLADEGVRALIEVWMTRDPPPLQHLNFQHDELTGAIVNPVLRLLGSQQLPALETLGLFGNERIDERSRKSLFGTFPEVVKFD
uniref:F-box domain-containing protein n=1 Tax=Chromera velia CCMP2878 TaxID=1169474 RepID=A0A0G4HLN7_9ALVE|eukprot:Cvel_1159.t1-p1 / transcript=Cvel_1159.t1 / gene=Cvel_1159 / organism=Chromera_velia_CCMP2878 / gene_product=hypothetical protein / transcript_product=hypothetical protein / location=Cvel_scaffold38:99474-107005(+) / protein_length=1150 / sequence_SO=supercontig / SO=protein_coding / is_pseudo=false